MELHGKSNSTSYWGECTPMKTDAKVTFRAEAQTIGHYDIVVAGGGPAGVAASVVSSRAGMKTLLVESKGCLGGVATSAGVAVWLGGGKKGKTPCKWAVGGIFREIYDVLLENGWASEFGSDMGVLGAMGGDHIYFDMEHLKRVLDGFVTSAGVDLLYFTTALSLKIKENKIEPALVIGLPVGFVNAAESKAALLAIDTPYISNVGRKGGSNIAAAVVNALIIMAEANKIENPKSKI